MDGTQRDGTVGLDEQELHALAGLQFFDLVEELHRLYPDAEPVGSTKSTGREPARFKANATFGFPPNEVHSVERSAELAEGVDVRLNLIGLYGPPSPLPTNFTERIIHAALLYLVWRQYRHDLRYRTGGTDPISQAAGALFGLLPTVGDAESDAARSLLLPYVGLLSMYSRSASAIASVLTHFFEVPFEIEEFVARWIALPEDARFELGGPLVLGSETVLGEIMQDVAGHFRVWCGPLDFERYKSFLPGRQDHDRLRDLIDLLVRDPLSRDLGFQIRPETVPAWSLGEGELGWTTWADPRSDLPTEVVI